VREEVSREAAMKVEDASFLAEEAKIAGKEEEIVATVAEVNVVEENALEEYAAASVMVKRNHLDQVHGQVPDQRDSPARAMTAVVATTDVAVLAPKDLVVTDLAANQVTVKKDLTGQISSQAHAKVVAISIATIKSLSAKSRSKKISPNAALLLNQK
jgi:hypothetical protein